jgi:hypothetical protein
MVLASVGVGWGGGYVCGMLRSWKVYMALQARGPPWLRSTAALLVAWLQALLHDSYKLPRGEQLHRGGQLPRTDRRIQMRMLWWVGWRSWLGVGVVFEILWLFR